MLEHTPTRIISGLEPFSRAVLTVWGLSIAVVCYLSLTPEVEYPLDFKGADLAYHSLAYLWLSTLPFFGFQRLGRAVLSALLMISLGVGLEFAQGLVPGRLLSVADMGANALGAVLGMSLGLYWRRAFSGK